MIRIAVFDVNRSIFHGFKALPALQAAMFSTKINCNLEVVSSFQNHSILFSGIFWLLRSLNVQVDSIKMQVFGG